MVVMEGEPKEIWSLLPYGESDDPSSPHFNDQTKLHSRREIKKFWSRHNKSETTQSLSGVTVVAWAGTFDCGRQAGPKHMSGKPDLNSAACREDQSIPVATLFGSEQESG
jgi:hypothetical protein